VQVVKVFISIVNKFKSLMLKIKKNGNYLGLMSKIEFIFLVGSGSWSFDPHMLSLVAAQEP
jgi:hypothetical protein